MCEKEYSVGVENKIGRLIGCVVRGYGFEFYCSYREVVILVKLIR